MVVLGDQPTLAATGQVGRQAYTGSQGRITPAGPMSLCLLLVTDLVTSALQAGTGNTNLNPQLNNALVALADGEEGGPCSWQCPVLPRPCCSARRASRNSSCVNPFPPPSGQFHWRQCCVAVWRLSAVVCLLLRNVTRHFGML